MKIAVVMCLCLCQSLCLSALDASEDELDGSVYFDYFQSAPYDWYSEDGDPLLELESALSQLEILEIGGLGDWRLPEEDELLQMFENRHELSGLTVPGFYWSASRLSVGMRVVDFFSGYKAESRPGDRHRVRPVRSLTQD
ncbi:Lcl C-terminal domain-containing protein [Spirochaeta dissipatitropha]